VNLDAPSRLEIKPISPDLSTQPPATSSSRDLDPKPEPGPSSSEPPAVVDIRPSNPAGREPTAGSEPLSRDPNEANVLIRVARQHFLTGEYGKAADAYSKALAAGADPGPTNQRLAQCLEKLGQRSAAASAYERAMRAYEAALNSGKGDPAKLKAALDACRQAAKLAQGG
jgi:tetratricopeptide (TPR) repeat protein